MNRGTISKIVKESGVSAGYLVLVHFWDEDADKGIANDFVVAVSASGATPVLLQQARSINRDLFQNAKESCYDDRYHGKIVLYSMTSCLFWRISRNR